MSTIDQLLQHARTYARDFDQGDLPMPPARRLAVVTCMDARIDPAALLGLREGDAHVIRNAGGLATADVIRSLAISQRMMGTTEVAVIHHTGCGMLTLSDPQLREQLEAETGVAPDWTVDHPGDLDEGVRTTVAELRASPFLPDTGGVRGFVYEVETGSLREVR
jgi:carbonic anhydrase